MHVSAEPGPVVFVGTWLLAELANRRARSVTVGANFECAISAGGAVAAAAASDSSKVRVRGALVDIHTSAWRSRSRPTELLTGVANSVSSHAHTRLECEAEVALV